MLHGSRLAHWPHAMCALVVAATGILPVAARLPAQTRTESSIGVSSLANYLVTALPEEGSGAKRAGSVDGRLIGPHLGLDSGISLEPIYYGEVLPIREEGFRHVMPRNTRRCLIFP